MKLWKQNDKEVIAFCDGLNKSDIFLLDQYWLLLYQLYFDGKIINPYTTKTEICEFETLKNNKINFVNYS